MAYIYKGTQHEVDPEPAPRAKTGVFDPDKCGSYAGYKQHQNYGTPSCDPCKAAQADYSRTRWESKDATKRGFEPSKCGTHAGWQRHIRTRTPTCGPCREARAAYMTGRYVKVRAVEPCGTPAAYRRHRYAGEPACTPCKKAWAAKKHARLNGQETAA